jgi:hypothetical protein
VKADLAASIHAGLSARAKERGEVFQDVLTRYGVERFLYRLSCTPARETLWLKGALLFDLWFGVPHRPTRDADFLEFGPSDQAPLETAVRDACVIEVPEGMAYDPESMRVREIREDARYAGLRVTYRHIEEGLLPGAARRRLRRRGHAGAGRGASSDAARRSATRHCARSHTAPPWTWQ